MRYAEAFKSVINGALSAHSSGFDAIVYASAAPFCAVSFRLIDSALRDRAPVVETDANLDRALAELDAALQRDVTAGLYLRRSVKVFGTRTVHIVKPSERRYWTRSAAFNDADEVVVRLLSAAQVSAV